MDLRQLFLRHQAQTSDFPLMLSLVKAEGIYLYDENNKAYIDFISGIAVSNVGHRHPDVVKAIKEQVDAYLHQMVYGEYLQSPQIKLARALSGTLKKLLTKDSLLLDNVYFTNSGTEAVEGAMKLAKRYTGRFEFIACEKAYHGSTHGALALGEEQFKRNFRPLSPGVSKIRRNYFDDLAKINIRTAAVIIEPIGGEAGAIITDIEYMLALKQRCHQTGTLLIFDEIQSGFGRSGTFWAFEKFGFAPDILLTAKGMGGGMPIGAFIAPKAIMAVFKNNPILGHITTFGGHPVSCAAALATLSVVENILKSENIKAKGDLIKSSLNHPKILEIRGEGLMLAAEIGSFESLKMLIDKCIEKGLITDWFLYCDTAMRIAPPLVITHDEILKSCDIICSTLDEMD